jgi:hypothetical protein
MFWLFVIKDIVMKIHSQIQWREIPVPPFFAKAGGHIFRMRDDSFAAAGSLFHPSSSSTVGMTVNRYEQIISTCYVMLTGGG